MAGIINVDYLLGGLFYGRSINTFIWDSRCFWNAGLYYLDHFLLCWKKGKAIPPIITRINKKRAEVSPELLQNIPGYKTEKENGKRNDIRTGTITSGVGIGIALFGLVGVGEGDLIGVGLFVFSIGLGFLAFGIYNKDKKVDDVS